MNQTSHFKLLFFVLSCLAFSPAASSKTVEFDIAFDEFVLKNSYSLISQIKKKSGLGYQSLSSQITKLGCDSDILMSKKLLSKKKPYFFYKELTEAIQACNRSFNNKAERANEDLEQLLDNKEIYLITAGETLDSPMSYFGHSLLLFLDEKDFYFSPVISVLAPTTGQSILSQTVKGGFSTIPAEVSAIPLHQVISFYSNQESRSLRFVKLSNDTFNKDKLIDYFVQKLDSDLSYNFFTKNCSTYLYQALEYSCDCSNEDKLIVTPGYLAKKVQSLGSTQTFEVPSLHKQFNTTYKALTKSEEETVQEMLLYGDGNNTSEKLGTIAALASQLSFETYDSPYPSYVELREKYSDNLFLIEDLPEFSAYEGKLLDKLNLSSVKLSLNEHRQLIKLSVIDYNDSEQRSKKFTSSSISAGVLEIVREYNENKVNSFTLIDITTIRPIDFISKMSSWRFKINTERNEKDNLSTSFSFGMGLSASLFDINFYTIPSIDIASSTKINLYSGAKFKSDLFSIDYKNSDFNNHEFSLYHRQNSAFGYEYKIGKLYKKGISHTFTLAYYF